MFLLGTKSPHFSQHGRRGKISQGTDRHELSVPLGRSLLISLQKSILQSCVWLIFRRIDDDVFHLSRGLVVEGNKDMVEHSRLHRNFLNGKLSLGMLEPNRGAVCPKGAEFYANDINRIQS